MTDHYSTTANEEKAAQQAAFLRIDCLIDRLAGPPEHPKTQQHWMTRAMDAYSTFLLDIRRSWHRPGDRGGHLEQEQPLEATLAEEILSRSLLTLTCLAPDAVDQAKGH
jgi:hypothetical protein